MLMLMPSPKRAEGTVRKFFATAKHFRLLVREYK